ncbi:hypothetical protein L0128_06650 [candidate division KSB1 bacterium]|nr:hypothetical protein [candidate division KSB1 bacterium]
MADVFENSYVVILIIFVIYSVLKNMFRKVQAPPPRPVSRPITRPRPPAPQGQSRPGDIFKRELAELFDLPIEATPPEPVLPETVAPPTSRVKTESPKPKPLIKPAPMPTTPSVRQSIHQKLAATVHDAQALRERVIWIEVMTPRAQRRRWRAF